MIKIAHITTGHGPFDTRIFYKECKTLANEGYDVVLIVPHEHNEVVDGVKIKTVSKPKSRLECLTRTVWAVFLAALSEKAKVYHFHDYELLPVGILLKLFGKKVIYDIHENLPHRIMGDYNENISRGLRIILARIAGFLEITCVRFFDAAIVVTPAIAERFPPPKTTLVQNLPLLDELLPDTDAPPSKDQPLIVYAGEITVFRGIYEMILAMDLLPQQLGASLILAGRFSPPELEDEVKKKPGWEKVKYHGWKSRDILMPLIAKSQVGLVLFHPLPNHIEAQPNKLFEYMSMKIPLVASDFPLWRKIIGEINCGFLVDPLDPKAIAEAMQWLIEHPDEARAMGERGQKAVLNQYNWKHESQKLLKVYKEITG